jgi:hypothetical protein
VIKYKFSPCRPPLAARSASRLDLASPGGIRDPLWERPKGFVELSVVTDEAIEETVNAWVAQGWQLDAIRFVTTERSRRPTMAFVSFVREE